MPEDTSPLRLAYLTGEYPAVSHTFILREVEALREAGASVMTCSIRQTPAEQHPGPAEKDAAASTFYVLAAARNPVTLIRAQLSALAQPRRYFSALKLAFSTRSPGLKALIWQLFYFVEATVLAHKLHQERITHLHNHFADSSATVAMLTSALSGIPFSYTLHGPAELFEPRHWRLEEKTARASFVACISYFCRSQAMYFSDPVHWHKLRIIHCGVLPELYAAAQQQDLSDTDDIHCVFVGRLAAIKGLRVLMDAFEQARVQIPGLRLTLVGDGVDRAALEERAAPWEGAVQFTGYQSQPQVAEILQTADIFVLPSFAEGVPVVLMEAMASARPVISSQVAGIPELVEDGVSGYLVPPGDADSLATRMIALAKDPALRQHMGAAGQQKVAQEFNIQLEAARLLALFEGRGGTAPRPNPQER